MSLCDNEPSAVLDFSVFSLHQPPHMYHPIVPSHNEYNILSHALCFFGGGFQLTPSWVPPPGVSSFRPHRVSVGEGSSVTRNVGGSLCGRQGVEIMEAMMKEQPDPGVAVKEEPSKSDPW